MGKRRKTLPAPDEVRDGAVQVPAQAQAQAQAQADWLPMESAPDLPDDLDAGRPSIRLDKRRQDRISQRELGLVLMSVRIRGGDWQPVRLWDFSSIGFGVCFENAGALQEPLMVRAEEAHSGSPGGDAAAAGSPARSLDLREGDDVEVRIKVRAYQEFEAWCKVMNVAPHRGGLKIGLRRQDVNFPQMQGSDRRAGSRLPLLPTLSLWARAKHPFIFGHWCSFRVADVNNRLGFSFLCEDPSILLFEGMELAVHFELAAFRNLPIRARVTWVHATKASEVKFGIECLEMDWRLNKGLCDYMLFSRSFTPTALRSAGFRAQQVKGHLRFRAVKTMEDYADVLRLRRDAYVGAGKRPEATTPEDMATPLDGSSRILMARHHGTLVGTLTFTFPAGEDTLLDSQACFPGQKYPIHLPPKANLIEVSRLCIHDDYRGTDLLLGLFEHGLKHFLLSDRHWLLTSATDELAPLYERIGFTRLKASYRHALLNNKEHHLLIVHKSAFLWGLGIGFLAWNSVFGDLVQHLLGRNLVKVPGWMRAIIRAKLLLRPAARFFTDARTRKAFRKHLAALRMESRAGVRKADHGPAGKDGAGSLYQGLDTEAPEPPRTKTGT